jgi:hypothetical protein
VIDLLKNNKEVISLLLTIIAIITSLWSLYRSIKIQKEIAKRDMTLTLLDKRMEIYNVYCESVETLNFKKYETLGLLGLNHEIVEEIKNIFKVRILLCSKYNQAQFHFRGDEPLIGVLSDIRKEYLCISDLYMIALSKNLANLNLAWEEINKKFPLIKIGDMQALLNIPKAKDSFNSFLKTPETEILDAKISEYIESFDYDKFDKYFENYFCLQKKSEFFK